MLFYILKRIALMVPTLLGALTITFVVMQFVPGGPVEQIMAEARAGQTGGDSGGCTRPAATATSGRSRN
jgi:microcin C transport system permease protein